MNWDISYNEKFESCKFILLEKYSEFQVDEALGCGKNADYSFIICKKAEFFSGQEPALKDRVYKEYLGYYEDRDITDRLIGYKYKYNQEVRKLWGNICLQTFISKIKKNPGLLLFYNKRIVNQRNKL